MKRLITLLSLFFVLTSCNFTEEISFNEDGSGEFMMTYDLADVMAQMKEMGVEGPNGEVKEPQKMDSVMYFKDMIKENADSIAKLPMDEQKRIKALENFMMKMRMDEAEGIFDLGIGSSFKSLEELPEVLENLDEARKINSKEDQTMSKMDNSAVAKAAENSLKDVDYKYDGNTFSRSLNIDTKRSKEDVEALNAEMEQMGEGKDMFEAMSYTLVYHFPKPIKSVSNKKAQISDDGKTVKLKMNFIEMIKTPELMNLDVVLEN